jgi:RNA polymerase sigma factor (sigma-70 family)
MPSTLLTRAAAEPSTADPFTRLYEQQVERIYRYHLARTGSPAEAEDLTAETFRAALEGFSRCRSGEEPAWLAGIARHKLVDQLRRERRWIPLESITERPHPAPAVEEQAGLRLEMAQVARVLRGLNPERAEAIALHYFAGLTLSQVGQVLGKSEEAAKKLVQRGLAEMREKLVETRVKP